MRVTRDRRPTGDTQLRAGARTANLPDHACIEAFRHLLDHNAIWNRMVAPGDRLPIRPLIEVDLGPIHIDRLLQTGPVVMLFVRYAGSPACDAALTAYRDGLAPLLRDLDAHLLAVSPQHPGLLAAVKHRNDLDFLVAADPRHSLTSALNIGFASPGADTILGTPQTVLPFATALVVDRSGIVRFAEIRPNWSSVIAPNRIRDAVQALRA